MFSVFLYILYLFCPFYFFNDASLFYLFFFRRVLCQSEQPAPARTRETPPGGVGSRVWFVHSDCVAPCAPASAAGSGRRDPFLGDQSRSAGRGRGGRRGAGRQIVPEGPWSGVLLCQAQRMSSGLSGLFSATV